MTIEECVAQFHNIDLEKTKKWFGLLKVFIPSFVTLVAVVLAYLFALSQARKKRVTDLIEKQLTEFYSPILGCIRKIHAQSKLRFELSGASDVAWKKICENAPHPFLEHEKKFEPFRKIIDYENKKLNEEVIPLYDNILNIFTSNYWLSEDKTRQYYDEYYRFVEIWHRYLSGSIPSETLTEIKHGKDLLEPFYKNIEQTLSELKHKLKTL